MTTLIVLLLLLSLVAAIGCGIWGVLVVQRIMREIEERQEWERMDQELRDIMYADLYERYEEWYEDPFCGTISQVTSSTMSQVGFLGTSVASFGGGGAVGRPWNDVPPVVPPVKTTRILPYFPEVPGAD